MRTRTPGRSAMTGPSPSRPRKAAQVAQERQKGRIAAGRTIKAVSAAGKAVSRAIGVAAEPDTTSWYLAKFASATGTQSVRERAIARYALRDAIGDQGVTTLPRLERCGLPMGNGNVVVRWHGDVGAYADGVESCGSPWACPVCAAKIRNRRAQDIVEAVRRHVDSGGGVLLVTWTLPHEAADRLHTSFDLLKRAMRQMSSGRANISDNDCYGVFGRISAYEITHGGNGWHPHLHQLVFTEANLSRARSIELNESWQSRWDGALQRLGWRKSADRIGVRVDLVRRGAAAAAEYIAKLQEGERWDQGAANELARGDLKGGRLASRTPFEIVAEYLSTGNAEDFDLWQEFERATKGRSSIRWSRGLRARLLPDVEELTDEEAAAAAEVDGDAVAVLSPELFQRVRARPYGVPLMFAAAEAGGYIGICRWLKALGIGTRGLAKPDPSMNVKKGEM